MSRFTYLQGQWTDGNTLPEWSENEEFSDYLSRIGYSTSKLTIGSEHGSSIEIYEASDSNSFYANVCPSGATCYEVFLPDFPSLMLFLKDFGPTFSALDSASDQNEILSLLEKLFRAYHGHASYGVCSQCAPEEWEALKKARETSARSKASKAASEA